MNRILTYDSTLRDGEQCEGITLSLEDKLRIVERLDAFRRDFIEGGFRHRTRKTSRSSSACRRCRLSMRASRRSAQRCKKDVARRGRPRAGRPRGQRRPGGHHRMGKSGTSRSPRALLTTLDENPRMIRDSVAYLKAQGLTVVFG